MTKRIVPDNPKYGTYDESARMSNNRFFDASMINGWLRREAKPPFRIRYINDFLVRRLGYESREALLEHCCGNYAALYYPGDSLDEMIRETDMLSEESNRAFTYRLAAGNGDAVWICEIAHKYTDADGSAMLLGLCVDITEHKNTEEALERAGEELRNERTYLKLLDEHLPIGTILLKLAHGGKMAHIGGTLLESLGYTAEEYEAFQQVHLRGFVCEEDYGTLFNDRRDFSGVPLPQFEQEYRAKRKDGACVWLYEKGTLVQLPDGPAYIIICMDVTRRKRIEERLRVSEEETALAMAQLGKMVCLYDVGAHTLTMPEAYAKKHGLPAVVPDVPMRIADALYLDGHTGNACQAFFHAIQRGEKTGSLEIRIGGADGTPCWERGEFVTVFDTSGLPVKAVIAIEDTTQQHIKDDEALAVRESERVLRVVAAHSSRLIFRYDIPSRTAYCDAQSAANAGTVAVSGNMPEGAIERGDVLPDSIDDFRRLYADIHAGKPEGGEKIHMSDGEGRPRWVDMRYTLIDTGTKKPTSAVISFQDISGAHEREIAFVRYRQRMLDEASTARMVYFDTDLTEDVVEKWGGNIPFLSFPECGCRHEDAARYGIEKMVPPEVQAQAWALFSRDSLLLAFAEGKRSFTQDLPVLMPDGERCWFRADIQMIQDPYSGHIKVFTKLLDVTEETCAAQEVRRQAETDGMTGLYNKAVTEMLVRERLAARDGGECLLLITDLDGLKAINDNLGHAQGDRAIKILAEALRSQFRHGDIVGRFGGDEFLIFLCGVGNEKMIHSTMTSLIRRISAERIGEDDAVALHASIGGAFGVAGRDSFDELYRKADCALYHVKRNGKNDYAFYQADMEAETYTYQGHAEMTLWHADTLDHAELDRLLFAVSQLYPLVISVNLTKNRFSVMQNNSFISGECFGTGLYDKLVERGAMTYAPEDRASFAAVCGRDRLLAAYGAGERMVSHTGRQMGDDGIYRMIRTDVIFTKAEPDNVTVITLTRTADYDAERD